MTVIGIDHVLIAVPDLEATRAEFASLGFCVTPRAQHDRFGTANYLIILHDAYLELITVENPSPPDTTSTAILCPCIAAGGGVPMMALATRDAVATRTSLAAAGYDVGDALTWSRPADTPDGRRTAEFTTLFSHDELLPGFKAFFCQHHTPGFVLHPEWQRHENGARCLVGIERSISRDLIAVERQLRRFLGPDPTMTASGGRVQVRLGTHVLGYGRNAADADVRIGIALDSIEAISGRNERSVQRIDGHTLDIALASVGHVALRFTDSHTGQS